MLIQFKDPINIFWRDVIFKKDFFSDFRQILFSLGKDTEVTVSREGNLTRSADNVTEEINIFKGKLLFKITGKKVRKFFFRK